MIDDKKVCIVGPGRMGIGIATALLACDRGLQITLLDLKSREKADENGALNRAREAIGTNLALLEQLGELKPPAADLLAGVSLKRSLDENIGKCAFVFEALPEKPEIKKAFIKQVEPFLHGESIIASATSTINLDSFWEVSANPERIVIAHWLNPAFIIPLVEISVGDKTSPQACGRLKSFLEKAGKIPVTLRDSPGFIVPRIQVAAMNEAVRILEEGVATPEDIDTAIKAGFGFRLAVLGLIEFIDLGGLDILYHASNYLYEKLGHAQYEPPKSVIGKMEAGEIGPKTGKGYFDYTGVNTAAMFKRRYQGVWELLNLFRKSKTLSFKGGIEGI
jgi:3-hydroxybutyryl-CoA dehydrogenase